MQANMNVKITMYQKEVKLYHGLLHSYLLFKRRKLSFANNMNCEF